MMMVAIVAVVISCRPTLGTIQQSKQARVAKREAIHNIVATNRTPEDRVKNDKEIRKVQEHLNSQLTLLSKTPDTLDRYLTTLNTIYEDSAVLKYLKSKFSSFDWSNTKSERLRSNANKLANARDSIMYAYVTDQGTPKELTGREEYRRLRGNVIRRQELTFQKIALSPVYGDKVNGFEGIIANFYVVPITFQFVPLNGGEGKSILVDGGKTVKEKLIPGNYRVHFLNGGKELCPPSDFTVDNVVQQYNGESCHWFTYMPRFF